MMWIAEWVGVMLVAAMAVSGVAQVLWQRSYARKKRTTYVGDSWDAPFAIFLLVLGGMTTAALAFEVLSRNGVNTVIAECLVVLIVLTSVLAIFRRRLAYAMAASEERMKSAR